MYTYGFTMYLYPYMHMYVYVSVCVFCVQLRTVRASRTRLKGRQLLVGEAGECPPPPPCTAPSTPRYAVWSDCSLVGCVQPFPLDLSGFSPRPRRLCPRHRRG